MILVLLLAKTKYSFREYRKSLNLKMSLIAVGLGACGGMLLYLLWPFLAVPADISVDLNIIGLTELTWPLFLAYHILVNPWIEEYYWRGFLGSNSKGIIINDLFFAGYHLLVLAGKMDIIWLAACFVILCGAAWFWRQTNRISGSLYSSTASHFVADLTIMLAIYFMTKPG